MKEPTIPQLEKSTKKEKIKKLFGKSFEIDHIEEGDMIPIGGRNMLSNEIDIEAKADFKNFDDFFEIAEEIIDKNIKNLPQIRKNLDATRTNISEETFLKLIGFTSTYNKKYPLNPKAEKIRNEYTKGSNFKISEIFNLNAAQCAEIAALAQFYLQKKNVSSSYFSGEVIWKETEKFGEAHSFIIIRENGEIYIYDPTNPITTASGKLPRLFSISRNFDEEMQKNTKRFLKGKDAITEKEAYYGIGNGTNVNFEQDVLN